jgi:uncharacterized peroxidase-related enzyme
MPDHPELETLPELYASWPEPFQKLGPYAHAVMRSDSPLSPGERELIAAYVSALNSCAYCHGVHAETARHFDMDPGILSALIDDPDTAPVPERLRPILAYVRVLTETPSRATDKYTQAIRDAGWNDDAIVYTVATTAYFNMMNRLVDGLGLSLKEGYAEMAGAMIARNGYAGLGNSTASLDMDQ